MQVCALLRRTTILMIMDSVNAIAIISDASESHIQNNRIDSFSESSSCQEEKKDSGGSCDESNTKRSNPQHEKQPRDEENVAGIAQRQSRRNSASSSGYVPPRTPQHQTRPLRAPDHSNVPTNELLGLSLFPFCRNREATHFDGVPAKFSDDALERYASRIRQELRHKEMMELAEAAERAAEAGEESFAVRPSTFGSSEWSAMNDSISVLGTPTTSTVTRPHRLTPLLIRKRIEKIGVTELRDVHEVFPDFGEFHTHLRTHLVRGGVDRETTIFQEKDKKNNGNLFPLSSSSGKKKGRNFLRDLNDWISPSNETALKQENSQNICTSAWDIGNIISEHINLTSSKSPRSRLHPETRSSKQQSEEASNAGNHIRVDAQLSASFSEKCEEFPSKRKAVRRALFDDDDFTQSQSEIQSTQNTNLSNTQHPSVCQDVVKHRADFVTPVRLRYMRQQSDADNLFDVFGSSSSLVESPLKILKESEQRLEKTIIALHGSSALPSPIMLPRQLPANSSGTPKMEKKEKHMYAEEMHKYQTVEDSRDEVGEDMPIDGFPIIGPLLLDGITPDISQANSRLDEMGTDPDDDVLLNTQLIRLKYEPENQYTNSIQTPVRDDCGCLSIPANSSLESNNVPKLLAVHEDRSSFSGGVNPLAGLISRMSPSRRAKENRLYFRSQENDAFLNNYLYCGKPVERSLNELPNDYLCSGPCHDLPNLCIEVNVDSCCTAILPDTFTDNHRKTTAAQSFVSLGGTPSVKSEAEIWYDRAAEGFDHFLEQWTGAQSTSGFSAWNVSFKAPTLNMKKVLVPHADVPTTAPTRLEETVSDCGSELDLE